MSEDFRQKAVELIRQNGYKRIAEIGVWEGELSKMIASLDIEILYLVDPLFVCFNDFYHNGQKYECTMGKAKKNQRELNAMHDRLLQIPKTKMLRLPSVEAAEEIPNGSLDFVFIDSIHTFEHCKDDIYAWLPKIRRGGMIAGDDYVVKDNAVSRAVQEVFPQFERVWHFTV